MLYKLGLLIQASLAGKREGKKKADRNAAELAELYVTGTGNACNPNPCSTVFLRAVITNSSVGCTAHPARVPLSSPQSFRFPQLQAALAQQPALLCTGRILTLAAFPRARSEFG